MQHEIVYTRRTPKLNLYRFKVLSRGYEEFYLLVYKYNAV
jgi:hypothetical protein